MAAARLKYRVLNVTPARERPTANIMFFSGVMKALPFQMAYAAVSSPTLMMVARESMRKRENSLSTPIWRKMSLMLAMFDRILTSRSCKGDTSLYTVACA